MRSRLPTVDSLSTAVSRLSTQLHQLASAVRSIAGMPDYHAYVEHQRHCHPERPLLGEREFFAEHLRARYADGPNRCC